MSNKAVIGNLCAAGVHIIMSEADIIMSGTAENPYPACIYCTRAWKRESYHRTKKTTQRLEADLGRYISGNKYFVIFECGHENSYLAPLPEIGSFSFCMPCRDYKEVQRWGESNATRR